MRTEKLDALVGKKCDAVLITSNSDAPDMNLEYYGGIDATQAGGAVFWRVGRAPTLVTRDTAQKAKVRVVERKTRDTAYEELKKLRPGRIGVNMDYLPVNVAKRMRKKTGARLVDVSKEMQRVRAIKENAELKSVSKACDETRKVLKGVETTGQRECDVYAGIIEAYAKRALPVSFDPIVSSGGNTRLIHSRPSARRIGVGDTVIIDTGCRVDGYCSDITETHCAQPDAKTEDMLLSVSGASELAWREARPGMKAFQLCELVKTGFGGYAKYWAYGLGHGIGLDVHEHPNLSLESADVLREGMVFTLEPGLVGPGQGARIEHTGVLTRKGFKRL